VYIVLSFVFYSFSFFSQGNVYFVPPSAADLVYADDSDISIWFVLCVCARERACGLLCVCVCCVCVVCVFFVCVCVRARTRVRSREIERK
jgi:hypothetical protein